MITISPCIYSNESGLLVSDPLLACWCTTCHLPKYPDLNSGCLGLSMIELMTFMTSLLLMWKKLFAKLWWTGQINSWLTQSTMFRSEAIKVFCSSTMPHCDVTSGGERIWGTTPPTWQWKSPEMIFPANLQILGDFQLSPLITIGYPKLI